VTSPLWRRRSRRELLSLAVVCVGLFVFVALAYVVIVLGGGALIGHTSSPHLGLSVLATAVVALAFDPVQTWLEAFASRAVHGGQPSPYDVLRRFTSTLAGNHPQEELPERMARVLADGTGAEWAQVWVVLRAQPVLAATWPPHAVADPGPDGDPRTRRLPVRQGEELLGELVVRERDGVPLTSVEERLFAGLSSQAGLVLRGARLRAQLELRLAELSARADELRVSRERLVDAHDAERVRLERDIHDGAQQHLVALAVNLRLAATLAAGGSPERAAALLVDQEHAADDAVATVVQLSRGIYPERLEEAGVAVALRAAIGTADESVEIIETHVGRYPAHVEAAAYFCCLEALQNAAKHASATTIRVDLRGDPDALMLTVTDDGVGFDPATTPVGSGLANIRDRVESVGGTLTTDSTPGGGTRVRAVLAARALATTDGGA
jgi:signal transduction histidine kinase